MCLRKLLSVWFTSESIADEFDSLWWIYVIDLSKKLSLAYDLTADSCRMLLVCSDFSVNFLAGPDLPGSGFLATMVEFPILILPWLIELKR